jgi:hypothetical protein
MELFAECASALNLQITNKLQRNNRLLCQPLQCRPMGIAAPFAGSNVRNSKGQANSLSNDPQY